MTDHMTQQEMLKTLCERFGKDPMNWAFVCPSCGDVATGQDFREALRRFSRKNNDGKDVQLSQVLGQQCIGRVLGALSVKALDLWKGRGCDWTAYCLFRGPMTIEADNGEKLYAFRIAKEESS